MAEVLKAHDFNATQHGNALYPWPTWTDGRTYKITRGADFEVEPRVMQGQLKVRAGKEQRKVATAVDGDAVTFTFQRAGESLPDFTRRTTTEVLGSFSDRLLVQLEEGPQTLTAIAAALGVDEPRASRTLTYLAGTKGRHRVERVERSDEQAPVWQLTATP